MLHYECKVSTTLHEECRRTEEEEGESMQSINQERKLQRTSLESKTREQAD